MPLAILRRRRADMRGEGAPQHIGIRKTAPCGDLLRGVPSLFQQGSRGRHSGRLNPRRRGHSDFAAKQPGKLPRAQLHTLSGRTVPASVIVEHAADLVGHRVEVRPVEGRGSCFTVVADAAALPRERGSSGSLGRFGCRDGLSYCLSDQYPAP